MGGNKMNSELQKKLEKLNIPTDYFSLLDWFEKRGIIIFLNKRVIGKDYCWKATVEITYIWTNNHDVDWWYIYNLNYTKRCKGEKRQDAIDKMVDELLNIIPIKYLENYENSPLYSKIQ